MNRRKFLSYVGCSCGTFILPSCTSAPITERKQLKIVSESKLNAQAAMIFEKIKDKEIPPTRVIKKTEITISTPGMLKGK